MRDQFSGLYYYYYPGDESPPAPSYTTTEAPAPPPFQYGLMEQLILMLVLLSFVFPSYVTVSVRKRRKRGMCRIEILGHTFSQHFFQILGGLVQTFRKNLPPLRITSVMRFTKIANLVSSGTCAKWS